METNRKSPKIFDFFGKVHSSRDYGTDWFDSDSVYDYTQSDGLKITCAIHPIHKDARITLTQNGHTIYDWQATALQNIQFCNNSLEFISQNGDKQIVSIKPFISINYLCQFLSE